MANQKPNKFSAKIRKAPINSKWFNNVAKSMGAMSADLIKDMVPNTSDFFESNASDAMEMVREMRSNVGNRTNVNRQISSIPQIAIGKEALKNALEDIKSGNINNTTRGGGFDDDMDFGFGDLFDDLDVGGSLEFTEENETGGQDVTVNQYKTNNVLDTLPLAKAMQANAEATVSAISAVAEQNIAMESEKFMFTHKSMTSITNGLNAINDNLSTLVKFHGDSTAKYYNASIQYYEQSIEELKKITARYDRQLQEAENMKKKVNKDTDGPMFEDSVWTYTGGLNMKEYVNTIKSNINTLKDENAAFAQVAESLTSTQGLKMLAANPLGFMAKMGMKSLVPVATKTAFAAVDASISSLIPAFITKINQMQDADNPIYQYISKIFGTKNKLDYKVDLGDYNRGPQAWDGQDKKTLNEVIPTYLRRMEAALTGQNERIYDYKKGLFVTSKELQQRYDEDIAAMEVGGYTATQSKMRQIVQEMGASAKVMQQFEKDMTEYFRAMTKKGSLINPFKTVGKDGLDIDELMSEGLFDSDMERHELFRKAAKGLSVKELNDMATMGIYDSRRLTQMHMDEIRKDPNGSGYATLNNGGLLKNGRLTYDPTRNGKVDSFGYNTNNYLRDIRSILATGIATYDPRHNPHKKAIRKFANESTTSALNSSVEFSFMNHGKSLEELLEINAEEMKNVYREVNADEGIGRDNKYAKYFGKKLGKVNDYSSTVAGMIDNKLFTILFGDDDEHADMFLYNKNKLQKMIKEDTGKGSMLGNTIGFFQDTIKGVGAYFTGQGYTKSDGTKVAPSKDSIIGQIKSFFSGTVEKTIGEKGNKEDLGLMGRISQDFMDGFGQFKKTLFGEKTFGNKMGQETIQDLGKKVKDRLPKSIGAGLASAMVKTAFSSQLGILGSVLLPGGPIGAALTGTTASFLMQSETFKNWLFGEKDKEGQRMGGFVPKSLMDKINKNGGNVSKNMKIGAGAGLLASFFLPGGPVTGAVMGMGAGMLTKHEKFQEFLYGKDFNNKDVKKSMANGTFGKLFKSTIGKAYKGNPKLATFLGGTGALAGLAQGVGLLPSFLLPGGPVTGAMLGLAGGIMASSDKFQNFLFGDKEEDGRRYGGLMTKFTNWFDTTVVTPMQIKAKAINDNIYEFVQGKIVNPAIKAFEPMTQAFKFVVDDAKSAMSKTWHKLTDGIIGSFNDNVIKPFGESLEKYVVDPLKRSFNFMLKIIGKGLGTLVSAPMKLLTGVGNMANIFNERHVMKAERKNRRDAYKANIAQKYADGTLGFKDIFGGLKDLRINKEEVLNRELSYREGWQSRDEERKAKLAEEMEKRRSATDDLRRQYEEDVAYGKSKNWKYASKRQKERHEEDVKRRSEWYQEQLAVKTTEVAKKVKSIDDLLKETPKYETDKRELLTGIKNAIYDQLDYLKELNGDDVKSNAKAALNSVGNKLTQKLKDAGQSHATGLDEVPKDGYVAELHEGEMVVPKKGAGFLRSVFGGNKENNKKNSIASALSTAAGFMGNMFKRDKSDRADNNFGFSALEQQQAKEFMDLERYQQASRKGVDYVQAQMLNRKKEKEDKKFKTALINAITGNKEEVKKGNDFWSNMFGANGLLGMLLSKVGPFAKKLLSLLGGLGGALGAAGLAALGGDIIKDKNDYDESGLKEEGVSFREYRRGVGDPTRLTHEGLYQYNSKADAETETLLRVGGKKYGGKMIQGTKNAWAKGKQGVQAAKGAYGKFAAFANPTKTGTTALSKGYSVSLPRQGAAQKAAGAVFDVGKIVKSKAKDTMSSLVALAKKALTMLDGQIAKMPKLKGIKGVGSKVGSTLTKLIADADVIVKKFGGKIALFFADGAADFIPLVGQVGEALMTGWDIATGLTKGNTGNLFGVSKDDVTWQMRIISSALQGACKFSWFSIIWMINEITSDQYGYSFLQEIAIKMYEMMPKNEVKATKLDSKLADKGMNADKNDAEALLRAAVDPDMADEAVKELSKKGLENITGKDLAKYGGSAIDAQEISRAAYNANHKTKMSKEAWKDKRATTVWDKMVGGKTAKNFKGTFSKRSAIGHLGLNKDAQLTAKERRNFAFAKTGINVMNFGRKLFGKEEIDDKEIFQGNWFDDKGRFTLNKKKQTQNYAQARTKKYQSKVDEANAKINERLENEPKSGIGKWWNNMMIGVQKGKRERAREKMGTDKKKKKKSKSNEKENAKQVMTNTKVKNSKEVNDLLIKSGAMDSVDSYSGGAGMGEGDNKKKSKKSGGSKNATASKKEIDKMHASFAKSIKKDANIITKGLSTGQKTLTKSFTALQKSLVSSGKVTSNRLKKETRKGEKDIDKMSKNLIKDAKKLFSALKDKVNKTVKDIKNIKITTAATISPTFTVDNPKTFMTDLFSDVLKKVEESKSKDKKKKNNAGSAGIATNLAPKANKESGSFISPTTNNNTTTNNSTNNKFVFYSQNDDRWSNKQMIGDKTIAQAGCGPTSLAMVISQMTGEEVTPDVIAQLGKKDLPGYSTYNLFPEIARKFAMNYEDTESASDIIRYLKEGTPVMLSGISNGANGITPYTEDGHVVVANSIQGDQVFVSDPRGKGYSRSYKIDDLLAGMNKAMVMKPTLQTKAKLNGRTMGRIRGVEPQYIGSLNTEIGKAKMSPAQLKANFGSDGQMKLFEKVLAYAKLFEGKLTYSQPRRQDINNNKLSADCSSFTQHVYDRVAGIDVGATSGPQGNAGVSVPLDQAQPGDLVAFDGHVGIVWDNNQMIDIGSGMGPKIRSFRSSYWMGRRPRIRRVLTDPNQTVDNVVNRANSALGTNTVNGLNLQAVAGGAPTSGNAEAPAVEQLGAFAKMGQIGQNFAASVFNGKEVDMFSSSGGSAPSNTTTGTAQINGRTVKALFTSYYPENSALQGGFLDAQGKPLDPSKNTCAAPKDIPFGAKIQIQGTGTEKDGQIYTVNDRGGAIKVRGDEYQFDLLSPNHDVAYSWGRKKGTAIISTDGASAGKEPDSVSATSGTIPSSLNGWAYYTQYDPRWQGKNSSFGGATVSGQGCGPTSQAMMLTTMFGQQVTPDVMAEFGYKTGGWGRIGMDWGMPAKTAKKFGLAMPSEWAGNSKDTLDGIKAAIKGGTPVLMSGQGVSQNVNSPFTTGGHLVLGVGVDGQNNIIINDPRGAKYTKAYTDEDMRRGKAGLRHAWAFAKTSSSAIPSDITTGGMFTPGASTSTTGSSEAPSVELMGAFDAANKVVQNYVASVFNGKEVDMFASSGGAATTGGSVDIGGINDTKQAVWKFFTGMGYSPQATAGIMGNLQQESTINPTLIQGNGRGPAAGIAQWENYNSKSARWKEMADHAASKGKDWTDLQSQLEFIDMELSGRSKDTYTASLLNKRYGGINALKSATDINTAADMFEKTFERAGKPMMANRYKYAKAIYDQFAGGSAGNGEGDGKVHLIQPKVMKGAKPVTKIGKSPFKGMYEKAGAGMGEGPAKVKRAQQDILKTINNNFKLNRTSLSAPAQQANTMDAYVDIMAQIVAELAAIRTNTGITAENTKEIKIASANEPISNQRSNSKAPKSSVSETEGKSVGYDMARAIASFR